MKNVILLFSIIFYAAVGFAQTAEYNDVSSFSFEGIKTEDGKVFYRTYYGPAQPDTPYNYVIEIYNADLKRIGNERVSVKYFSSVLGVTAHNGGLLFSLESGKEILIYHFNAQGKKVWDKVMEIDKGKFTSGEVVSLGNNGFALVRPDKDKKGGFRVHGFDNEMKEKWTQAYFPDKGNIDAKKVQKAGDKLAVLTHNSAGTFSNTYEQKVYVFSATDGKLLYEQEIITDEKQGKVQDFVLNSDGSTFFIGYRFDPVKPYDALASHLFYTAFDAAGNQQYFREYSLIEELANSILSDRSKRYFAPEDPPMLSFQDIKHTGNGYRIVAEAFKYQSFPAPTPSAGATIAQSGPSEIHILDYVIMNISADGKMTDIKRLAKPYKKIRVEGLSAGTSAATAEKFFKKYNLFSYRYMNEVDGEPQLVSLNWSQNSPYIGFTSLDARHENVLNRIHLNKTISGRETGDLTTYLFTKNESGIQHPPHQYNILPYNKPGKAMYYDWAGGALAMKVIDLKVDAPKPANGEVALPGIPARDFQGVEPIDDKGYYTFYFSEMGEDGSRIFIYHRLDKALNTLGRSVLVVPQNARFSGNVANGTGQVMVFQNVYDRSWYFYALDEKGTLTGQNKIALDDEANQLPTSNLLLSGAADGFFMLQPYRDTALKKNGYEVIRLNTNREVRWTWSHYAEENDVLELIAADAAHGLFAVLHTERPFNNISKKFLNKIMVVDDKTGKLHYSHDLYDGENSGFPESVKITADKSVVSSGMYFKGNKFDQQNSDGLFFLKLTGSGSRAFYSTLTWKEAEEALETEGDADFLISGKTKVLIEDIVHMPDGTFRVIGELYKKSMGTTAAGFLLGESLNDRAFSIYDFIVFEYGKTGELASVYRIPKAEQNIELPSGVGQQKGLSLSLMMKRYNMFSYLKTMNVDNTPYLIFTNTVDGEKKVYKAPIAKTTTTEFPSAPAVYEMPGSDEEMNKLEMFSAKLDKLGTKLDKAISGTDQVFTSYKNPYQGFGVAVPGEVLVYYYDPETRNLNLRIEKL